MAVYTTIDNPELYFQTKLYTGNGSTNAITLDGSENMQPDFTWIKERGGAENHNLFDSVRGVTKRIRSNGSEAEDTRSSALTAFGTDGFTLGSDNQTNDNSATYASWNWKAGTTISSTSTSGSGTAKTYTGSVSTTSGFSIIRYVGNGTAGHTIPHHLGKKPDAILVKHLGDAQQWASQWSPLGATKVMRFGTTNAVSDSNTRWNDTEPTTSVFTLGNEAEGNTNDGNHIAYCFTNIQGYSKIGSYDANENVDGPFIYTGFKPAFVILKQSNLARDWHMFDNKRSTSNAVGKYLRPNEAGAEDSGEDYLDLLSNGFKIKNTGNRFNDADGTYIYACFAENPFVTSTGVPATAR